MRPGPGYRARAVVNKEIINWCHTFIQLICRGPICDTFSLPLLRVCGVALKYAHGRARMCLIDGVFNTRRRGTRRVTYRLLRHQTGCPWIILSSIRHSGPNPYADSGSLQRPVCATPAQIVTEPLVRRDHDMTGDCPGENGIEMQKLTRSFKLGQ
jgi:hypothetical protein